MWHPPPPTKMPERNILDAPGLLVTGTHGGCGKTVCCAGVVGALNNLGFRLQAIKPLAFSQSNAIRPSDIEQGYFNRLAIEMGNDKFRAHTFHDAWSCPSPHAMSETDWRRLITIAHRRIDPYLFETPGSIGVPLYSASSVDARSSSMDVVDLAQELQIPILLVTAKTSDVLTHVPTALAYATVRKAPIIGWLAVETEPFPPALQEQWQEDVFYIRRYFQTPFLGEIPYSPSVSVEAGRQGNLYRLTENNLDLLPIQQTLNLSVPL